jgi:hypothetical protein
MSAHAIVWLSECNSIISFMIEIVVLIDDSNSVSVWQRDLIKIITHDLRRNS